MMNNVITKSSLLQPILRGDQPCTLWLLSRHNPQLSSVCLKIMSLIVRFVSKKFICICKKCDCATESIIVHLISFCEKNVTIREQVWDMLICKFGYNAYREFTVLSPTEQTEHLLRLATIIDGDTFKWFPLTSLLTKLL